VRWSLPDSSSVDVKVTCFQDQYAVLDIFANTVAEVQPLAYYTHGRIRSPLSDLSWSKFEMFPVNFRHHLTHDCSGSKVLQPIDGLPLDQVVIMSLYHEAASILDETRAKKCSIKSLVYTVKKGKEWKSDPKALFALSTEAAKWSEVLAEVVGRSGVLGVERMVCKSTYLEVIFLERETWGTDCWSSCLRLSRWC